MPKVIDNQGIVVYEGGSDAECVRWWRREGTATDYLDDGSPMSWLDDELSLD